jgi:hypothetical protein
MTATSSTPRTLFTMLSIPPCCGHMPCNVIGHKPTAVAAGRIPPLIGLGGDDTAAG